jgi:hypothetical protein
MYPLAPYYGAIGVPFIQQSCRRPSYLEIMMLTHHQNGGCGYPGYGYGYQSSYPGTGYPGYGYGYPGTYPGRYY